MVERQLSFLEKFPKGIYKMDISSTLDGEEIDPEDKLRFERDLNYLIQHPEEGFIPTSNDFLQRWINHRLKQVDRLPQAEYQNGFELYLPQVDIKRFDDGGSFGRIEGVIIASDFDYSGDFRGNLVFGVNHLPSKRALTYYDEGAQEFAKNPRGLKRMESLPIYRWSNEPEKFPFDSLNPLKSADCSYTLVNVSPEEVYCALEKIGFRL